MTVYLRSWWGFYLLLKNRKFSCHVNKDYVCVQSWTSFMEYSTSISLQIQPNTCHPIWAYVSQVFSGRENVWLTSFRYFFRLSVLDLHVFAFSFKYINITIEEKINYELFQCVILSMLSLLPLLCFQITSTTLFICFLKSRFWQRHLSYLRA
jgi:hypothetical protein